VCVTPPFSSAGFDLHAHHSSQHPWPKSSAQQTTPRSFPVAEFKTAVRPLPQLSLRSPRSPKRSPTALLARVVGSQMSPSLLWTLAAVLSVVVMHYLGMAVVSRVRLFLVRESASPLPLPDPSRGDSPQKQLRAPTDPQLYRKAAPLTQTPSMPSWAPFCTHPDPPDHGGAVGHGAGPPADRRAGAAEADAVLVRRDDAGAAGGVRRHVVRRAHAAAAGPRAAGRGPGAAAAAGGGEPAAGARRGGVRSGRRRMRATHAHQPVRDTAAGGALTPRAERRTHHFDVNMRCATISLPTRSPMYRPPPHSRGVAHTAAQVEGASSVLREYLLNWAKRDGRLAYCDSEVGALLPECATELGRAGGGHTVDSATSRRLRTLWAHMHVRGPEPAEAHTPGAELTGGQPQSQPAHNQWSGWWYPLHRQQE
jgi:hypothetical protein